MGFQNSPNVKAMQATVQVKKCTALGSPANPSVASSRVRVKGNFFNAGSPTPGDQTNDVYAHIAVGRWSDSTAPPKVLRVVASVFQCKNQDCSTSDTIGIEEMGTVLMGKKITLYVEWDQTNNRFIFKRDKEPEVFIFSNSSALS
jgi:hypothetical protein